MAFGAAVLVDGALDDELTAAAVILVDQRIDAVTRFALQLPLTIRDGDLPLLTDERLAPGTEIAVVAEHGEARECLVWGPVTGQRIALTHGGAGSTVTVEGGDLAVTLDREDRVEILAGVTDSSAISSLAQRNSLLSDIESTSASHPEEGHALVQRETDLGLVRRLARRNGYCWWVTATEQNTHTLHFRPAPVDEAPASELVINLEDPSVESLEIAWDAERPTTAEASQLDPRAKSVFDGSASTSPLAPLGAVAFDSIGGPSGTAWVAAAADDAADLQGRTGAVVAVGSFFARATGTTSSRQAGAIVRAPSVVRLRGAGSRHSGPWLCSRVQHRIDDAVHTMHFELTRNGWGES